MFCVLILNRHTVKLPILLFKVSISHKLIVPVIMAEQDLTIKQLKNQQRQVQIHEATSEVLKDITNLKEKVANVSAYYKHSLSTLEQSIKSIENNIDPESTLRIGKEFVRPLIETKMSADEIFANTKEHKEISMFNEESSFLEILERNYETLKKKQIETQQFAYYLRSTWESLEELLEPQKEKKANEHTNEPSTSSSSPSESGSASGFSLFENSNTGVVTSSPVVKNKKSDDSE